MLRDSDGCGEDDSGRGRLHIPVALAAEIVADVAERHVVRGAGDRDGGIIRAPVGPRCDVRSPWEATFFVPVEPVTVKVTLIDVVLSPA